jgi:hypothetical protein
VSTITDERIKPFFSAQGGEAMNQISLDEYIRTRVDEQMLWYSRASGQAQKWWKGLRLVEVIVAALIPFAAAYASQQHPFAQVAVSLLGVVVAVITGVLGVYKLQENWTKYRTTAEALKREKFLLMTRAGPYDGQNAEKEFVARIEGILGKESEAWQQATAKPTSQVGQGAGTTS